MDSHARRGCVGRKAVAVIASAALACSLVPAAWAAPSSAGNGAAGTGVMKSTKAMRSTTSSGLVAAKSLDSGKTHALKRAKLAKIRALKKTASSASVRTETGWINFKLDNAYYAVTGSAIRPVPAVTATVDDGDDYREVTLEAGKDFTLAYGTLEYDETGNEMVVEADTTAEGSYAVEVRGTGDYDFVGDVEFSVVAAGDFRLATLKLSEATYYADTGWYAIGYTGKPVDPGIELTLDGKTLVQGTDYTAAYAVYNSSDDEDDGAGTNDELWRELASAPTDEGSYRLRLIDTRSGAKEDSESLTVFFDIVNTGALYEDEDDGIWLDSTVYAASGEAVELDLSAWYGDTLLEEGADYELEYQDVSGAKLASAPSAAGSYTVVVKGTGIYSGEVSFGFRIYEPAAGKVNLEAADFVQLSYAKFNADGGFLDWDETDIDFFAGDTSKGLTLYLGYYLDDDEDEEKFVNPDEFDVVFKGADGTEADLSKPGTCYAVATAKDSSREYAGSCELRFEVCDPFDLQHMYADLAHSYTLTAAKALKPNLYFRFDELIDSNQYTVSYKAEGKDPVSSISSAGEYAVIFTAKASGTYKGEYSYDIEVYEDTDLRGAELSLPTAYYAYTGSAIKPKPAVTINGNALVEGTDYTLSYEAEDYMEDDGVDPKEVGVYEVIATGKGAYKNSAPMEFAIVDSEDFRAGSLEIGGKTLLYNLDDDNAVALPYTGSAFTLMFRVGGKELKPNVDYAASFYRVESDAISKTWSELKTDSIRDPGLYEIFLAPKNSSDPDEGFEAYVRVVPATITASNITLSPASASYTGKAITPAVTVTVAGKKLVAGTDYTVAYKNNVSVGTATVTVTGEGNYAGTATKNFTIAKAAQTPKVAQPLKLRKAKASYKAKKLKKKGASFKIGASGAKGKLSYALDKKAKKSKRIKVGTTGKVTIKKGLRKGTYKITVTAAASGGYAAATKTVTIKVK